MFKVLLLSLVIVSCQCQVAIPQLPRASRLADTLVPAPDAVVSPHVVSDVGPVAVAQTPIFSTGSYLHQIVAQLRGQQQQYIAAKHAVPVANVDVQPVVHKIYSQFIQPVRDLGPNDVVPVGPRVGPQIVKDDIPVFVKFSSRSQPVHVEHQHIPDQPGEVTITRSEDAPHHVIHEVVRPIIQEVREIIQPYRRVTQEIRPVKEEVHTSVAANPDGGAVAYASPAALAIQAQQVAVAPIAQSPHSGSYIHQIVERLRAQQQQYLSSNGQVLRIK